MLDAAGAGIRIDDAQAHGAVVDAPGRRRAGERLGFHALVGIRVGREQ